MFPCSSSYNPNSTFREPFFEDDDLFLNHFLSQNHILVGNASQDPTDQKPNIVSSPSNYVPAADDINKEKATDEEAFADQPHVEVKTNLMKRGNKSARQGIPRRRTGKKDRHSKICTAQGPRDRRMRLSLQVARKFFDLQDILGFDKASETIEWLFNKSKGAIKELKDNFSAVNKPSNSSTDGPKSVSSTTESTEVVSKVVETHADNISSVRGENFINATAKEKRVRKLHRIARESRDMARARARDRTREKMIIKGNEKSKQETQGANPNKSEMNNPPKMIPKNEEPHTNSHMLENQLGSVTITEKDLAMATARSPPKWVSSPSMFSHQRGSSGANFEDDISGFPENYWDTHYLRTDNLDFHCTVTNMKPVGSDQLQNPSDMFPTTFINPRKQESRSIFETSPNDELMIATTREQIFNAFATPTTALHGTWENPSSKFVTSSIVCLHPQQYQTDYFS